MAWHGPSFVLVVLPHEIVPYLLLSSSLSFHVFFFHIYILLLAIMDNIHFSVKSSKVDTKIINCYNNK